MDQITPQIISILCALFEMQAPYFSPEQRQRIVAVARAAYIAKGQKPPSDDADVIRGLKTLFNMVPSSSVGQ